MCTCLLFDRDARVRYLADRIAHICKSLVVVPELDPAGLLPSVSSEELLGQQSGGSSSVSCMQPFGSHGLIARTILWLHLHERAEALAVVGLADGGAEALTFVAKTFASAVLKAPRLPRENKNHSFLSPRDSSTLELRGLPPLDAVVALYPAEFNMKFVASRLKVPTLSLFDEPVKSLGRHAAKKASSSNASAASESRAAMFDSELRRHAQARDHWIQAASWSSHPSCGFVKELVSSTTNGSFSSSNR